MSSFVVLTAVGPDRPGLVDEISAFLAGKNVNIEDSRMAVLGGEFAIILLASGEESVISNLKNDLDQIIKTTGLDILMKPTISPFERKVEPSIPHRLHFTSLDHPGLVHEITQVLHHFNINIESMNTHVSNAPISGSPVFNMQCIINIPADKKLSAIKESFLELEHRLNIDIEFETLETY